MYDRITLPNGVRIVAEHVPGHAFGCDWHLDYERLPT